jgi:hypoxanthine phosphoribosyltransferase
MEERIGEAIVRVVKGAIGEARKRKEKRPIQVSWRELKKGILLMSVDLGASHWSPDVILGVGRGGTVIAGMLADNHRLYPPRTYLATLDRDTPIDVHGDYEKQVIRLENADIKSKLVLVVDTALHTGGTIKNIIKYLIDEQQVAEVKVYILYGNPQFTDNFLFSRYQNQYRGKFFAFENPEDRPIKFPWHWTEQAQKAHGY